MKKINECVGKIVKGINTTPDVNIHSIKQQSKKFGNDVTDEGDPIYNISEYLKYLKKDIKNSKVAK